MSYKSSLNSTSYEFLNYSKAPSYLADSYKDKKYNNSTLINQSYQVNPSQAENNNFLRSTMGTYKTRPNKDIFEATCKETDRKPEFNMRNTTGNLAALLKKIDFNKDYKQQQVTTSRKYSDLNINSPSFLKQKQPSIPILTNQSLLQKTQPIQLRRQQSSKNINQILNKYKREQQLKQEIQKLKDQKGFNLKSNQSSSPGLNSYSYKEVVNNIELNKNPEDFNSTYRKTSADYTNREKKFQYDFSKKNKIELNTFTPKKQYDFQKKYDQLINKKYDTTNKKDYETITKKDYDTTNKKQYEWSTSTKNMPTQQKIQTKNALFSQQQIPKNQPQITKNQIQIAKSPMKQKKKQDNLSKYFSSGPMGNGQKFTNKVSLKDFSLGKNLGEGKFGTVYQALHMSSRSIFALKKISKAMIKSHYMIDQFILELKLQSFMNNQHLLSLHGFFQDAQNIYLIMDYMQQGTLYSMLKKQKKLEVQDVKVKVKEIAKALIYMHQNGIAHRDIKPENVVMSHGTAKLCDFGWSTICDERRKTYCGTFDYAAPEILQGTEYDMSVDLWCLGVLTYELLVGKAPFYHIKKQQTKKKILNVQSKPFSYPADTSKDAIDFIDRLLKKDPQQRITNDQLLCHPFLKNI